MTAKTTAQLQAQKEIAYPERISNQRTLEEQLIEDIIDSGGGFKVVEVSADYQILPEDDDVNGDAVLTATLPAIADAVKPVSITATNGDITAAGDATIQGSATISSGTSVTFNPARGQWWRR